MVVRSRHVILLHAYVVVEVGARLLGLPESLHLFEALELLEFWRSGVRASTEACLSVLWGRGRRVKW
jgi:hypothetical protein